MPIKWKSYRWRQKYITVKAFADLPEISDMARGEYDATFTIEPEDKDDLYSMERLFLEYYQDPTEYQIVQNVFDGDLQHWEVFKNSGVIHKYYLKWKKKAEAKLLSEAMRRIVETAFDEESKNSFTALKFLVDRGNKTQEKKGAGRPKKEKEEETVDSKTLLADIARIKE